MTEWLARYVELAEFVAGWSTDGSCRVGAVIYNPQTRSVLAMGYNGFPRGVNEDVASRHERPVKHKFTEHAERNAIFEAAMHGLRTEGMGMAIPFYPCVDCARAIIQCGIREIVCLEPDFHDPRWGEDFRLTETMIAESGVRVVYLVRVAMADCC
jgi:dCMP deaminase